MPNYLFSTRVTFLWLTLQGVLLGKKIGFVEWIVSKSMKSTTYRVNIDISPQRAHV